MSNQKRIVEAAQRFQAELTSMGLSGTNISAHELQVFEAAERIANLLEGDWPYLEMWASTELTEAVLQWRKLIIGEDT